jgi:hemolysin activation/secretion protein
VTSGGVAVPTGPATRSRPISIGYTARTETDAAVWGYNTELAWNTGSGAHNDLASYQAQYPGIETVHWKALRGGANYTAPLAESWLWTARAQYQLTPDALILGEQFGLGGIGSVRGTEVDRPISGDSGVAVTLEATSPELFKGLRGLVFLDAGYLHNHNANGSNRPSSDRLAGVGVGLRYGVGGFAASLEYGRIIQGSRVPLAVNSSSPQKGDDRFYVNISYRF